MLAPPVGPNQTSEALELWYCQFSLPKAILQSSTVLQGLILMQRYYQVASYFLLSIHRKMYNYVTGAFDPCNNDLQISLFPEGIRKVVL